MHNQFVDPKFEPKLDLVFAGEFAALPEPTKDVNYPLKANNSFSWAFFKSFIKFSYFKFIFSSSFVRSSFFSALLVATRFYKFDI